MARIPAAEMCPLRGVLFVRPVRNSVEAVKENWEEEPGAGRDPHYRPPNSPSCPVLSNRPRGHPMYASDRRTKEQGHSQAISYSPFRNNCNIV